MQIILTMQVVIARQCMELLRPHGRGYVWLSQCDRNGNRGETIPHFQGQIFWVPWWNKRNTVTFASPIQSPLWSYQQLCFAHVDEQLRTYGGGMEDFYLAGWIGLSGATPADERFEDHITDSGPQLRHLLE